MDRTGRTQKIVTMGFLIALQIVLARFLQIETPLARFSFSFVPLAMTAVLYGPVPAAAAAGAADIIGTFLFSSGVYFPGFTISSVLSGLVYGLLLYRKPKRMWRIGLACSINGIFVSLLLGTYWLQVYWGKGFWAVLPTKVMQNVVMIPVRAIIIWLVVYRVIELVWKGAVPAAKPKQKPLTDLTLKEHSIQN